jgi:hypothetical protein
MDIIQVDELRLYFGNDIKIADGVILKSPTVGQIVDYGEAAYFSALQTLCATPSSMKVQLADLKPKPLDWMKVSEWQLFQMICSSFTPEQTSLVLGDLDLSQLKPYAMGESEDVILSNDDHTIMINEVIYNVLVTYLRKMHGFKKQVDKAGNKITHKVLLDLARQDAKMAQNKPYKSFLLPLVSSLQGRQGYTKDYIRNMGIFEFFNQINRAQIICQADAALGGMYSGMIDTRKMDKTILDWMRDITDESSKNNKTVLKEGAN